jgi:flagellum-specific ATP synthase
VGKSKLIAHLAQHLQADIIIVALIGERGRKVGEFVKTTLGPTALARSVVVAATSDMSPLLRQKTAQSAMSIAEYFRDQGLQVAYFADSITRFAEAYREVALSAGELPALRGYPASLAHSLMALCERAGPGCAGMGDITALFSVLVPGSDMEDPVADILRGVLDGHVVLNRAIAERGGFPRLTFCARFRAPCPLLPTPKKTMPCV